MQMDRLYSTNISFYLSNYPNSNFRTCTSSYPVSYLVSYSVSYFNAYPFKYFIFSKNYKDCVPKGYDYSEISYSMLGLPDSTQENCIASWGD